MKKVARLAIAALASAVLATPMAASPEIIEQVLVKVNGDIITKTELEQRQIAALRKPELDPASLQNDEQIRKALAEITPRLLVDTIDELLLIQLGREKGLRLNDEQFNRWLTNLRKEQNLVDDQKFQAALTQEGMTVADLRRNVEREFLKQEVQRQEIGSKLQITEEEARQYYLLHKQEFVEPAAVTLREILIEAPAANQPGAAPGAVEAGADKAAAARARIAGGEDFAKVAAETSAAPSKANGGLIGPIAVAELSQSLQDMLAGMKPGDVTNPVRTTRGFQIIKLETLKPAEVQAFDAVRDLVADRVYSQRLRTEMRRFLNRMRSQAIIVWKNEALKKAYEQQLATMAAEGA